MAALAYCAPHGARDYRAKDTVDEQRRVAAHGLAAPAPSRLRSSSALGIGQGAEASGAISALVDASHACR